MTKAEELCKKLVEIADYEFQFDVDTCGDSTTAQIDVNVLEDLIRCAQEALGQNPDWSAPSYGEVITGSRGRFIEKE